MNTGNLLAVLVAIALTASLFGANVAVAADRTAFDEAYVTEQFEESGVDTKVRTEMRRDVAIDLSTRIEARSTLEGISQTLSGEEIAEQGVTAEFIQGAMEESLEEIFVYLHGDREGLDIPVDLSPMKRSISETVVSGIEVETPSLVGSKSERLDEEQIAQLSESETAFEQAQMELSPAERTAIEDELETNVRVELDDDATEITAAVLAHQTTVLDGLTGELTHDEYRDQLETDEQRIKTAIGASAIETVPDRESLFTDGEEAETEFAPFATMVQRGTTLAWLLPLLSVGLIGAVYGRTRSVERSVSVTAWSLFVAGVVGGICGTVLRPFIVDTVAPIESGESTPLSDGLAAVVDGTLQTVGTQSLLLVVASSVLFGLVYADRQGRLKPVKTKFGEIKQ